MRFLISFFFLIALLATTNAQTNITGTVTENGDPLPGVNVIIKGTTTGTATDINGRYSINVPDGNAVLQFTFVGYVSKEAVVGTSRIINMEMEEDSRQLEEIVVVGYGTQRRANLTGAVDQITAETFENRPLTNMTQALIGVVPNLNIDMADGKPTGSPDFNIRGTSSIGYNTSGSALVLIDGIEGDPRTLNPNDIENISVLKDAASASIYGARATYGVILITTKSPTKGKTSITFTSNVSIKAPTAVPDNINDSYPWAQNFSDALSRWNDDGRVPTNVNKTMTFSQEYLDEIKRRWENPSLPRYDVRPNGEYWYFYSTDWHKLLYKDRHYAQDHSISVSGGNDIASYYVSGRYNGQDGLYRYNTDLYSQYNLRARGSVQLARWLKVENNTEFSNMRYRQPYNTGEGSNIWRNMADEAHPLAPLTNETDGTLSMSSAYTVGDMYLGKSFGQFQQRVVSSKFNATADFFNKSLVIRADYAFRSTDYGHSIIRSQVPYSRYQGVISYVGTDTNDFQERNHNTLYQATNIYADYDLSLNKTHNFHFLAGYNYEQSVYKNTEVRRNGIITNGIEDISLAIGDNIELSGGYTKWRIAGGFFRVNYNFKERYLLELNGRYDGSSRFPEGQQWGFFPSASVGWRISQEGFWNVNPKVISNLKLRASYGSLGNSSMNAYTFSENFDVGLSDRIIGTTRPQRTGKPNVIPASLTWETATTGNIGLDIDALNRRMNFSADFYRRWTKDMYTTGPTLPAIFGSTVPRGNYARLETTGFEFSIAWRDQFSLARKPFRYNVRITLADHTAKITEFINPEMLLSNYYTGQVMGEIWGYRVEGLFRSQEEIDNHPSQSNIQNRSTRKNYVGDLKFKHLEDDENDFIWYGLNRVGNSGSKTIIGNSTARFTYGVTLGADWNGFFFNSLFQGVLKQQWFPSRESPFWGQYNRAYNRFPRWHEGRQFKPELQNFDAYFPLLTSNLGREEHRPLGTPNDRYLQNVAYIRLRNLTFGYTIPANLTNKIGISNMRVYFSGENIWTWSPLYKYTKDFDVANLRGSGSSRSGLSSSRQSDNDGDGFNYPTLKTFSLGLSVTF